MQPILEEDIDNCLIDGITYWNAQRNQHVIKTPKYQLGGIAFKALPEEICELERLEKLTLWGTKIRELTEQIEKLKALKCPDL